MITNKKRICTVPYCTEPTFLLSISSRLFFLLHSPVSPFHLIAVTTCCCHQIIHACLYNTSLFFFFFPLLLFFSDHKKKMASSPHLPLFHCFILLSSPGLVIALGLPRQSDRCVVVYSLSFHSLLPPFLPQHMYSQELPPYFCVAPKIK